MIKYQKTNPIGIDYFISRFQTLQQRVLPDIFEVTESTCHFYGRAEIISDEKGNEKPVVFTSGENYTEVGFDNKINFISYFIPAGDTMSSHENESMEISLICHGNLSNIFSSVTTHRADHELRSALKEFVLTQIEPQDLGTIEIINSEIQPFHSLKINFKIIF